MWESAYDLFYGGHGAITTRVLQSGVIRALRRTPEFLQAQRFTHVFRLSNEAHMSSRLNPDDQQRVEEYLHTSQHKVERKPFRPWLLLVVVLVVVVGLGLLSRLLSYLTL